MKKNNWTRYGSIENSYRTKTVGQILPYLNQEGILREKIHGANLSFYADADSVEMGKRSGLMKEEEYISFFRSDIIYRTYSALVGMLWARLNTHYDGLDSITIYGEIFGGAYPHPDVEAKHNIARVQKEVSYSPDVQFMAYDVEITLQDGSTFYMHPEDMEKALRVTHIPVIDRLFTGTIKECLEYTKEFESTIYKKYDLPKLENNMAEGWVLQPNPVILDKYYRRWTVKGKAEAFAEKKKVAKPIKEVVKLPTECDDILAELESYINKNRLKAVISKIWPITQKEFGKLNGFFIQDILTDLEKDHPIYTTQEKDTQKEIKRLIGNITTDLIREDFANIIDGEY